MAFKFNFSAIHSAYTEVQKRGDGTLAFEVQNGHGRFLFMMFFAEGDSESLDRLFIYLRNTRRLLRFKMYGSHRNGDFIIYINPGDEQYLVDELQIIRGNRAFDFSRFLKDLNASIPQSLPPANVIAATRAVWPDVRSQLTEIVDEQERTILIGPKLLTKGKPQEKTLRKLYFYTDSSPKDIIELIKALRSANMTLAWTNNPKITSKTAAQLLEQMS